MPPFIGKHAIFPQAPWWHASWAADLAVVGFADDHTLPATNGRVVTFQRAKIMRRITGRARCFQRVFALMAAR